MNNPYTPREPVVASAMFFGRAQARADLSGYLAGNQSVAVVGPEQIGKTSLLRHQLRSERGAGPHSQSGGLLAYLHCAALSSGAPEDLFGVFIETLVAALDDAGEPALDLAAAHTRRAAFEGGVRRINQRGQRVTLILDDFEYLSANPQVDRSFFNTLRSAAGRYQLSFITASAQSLIELTYAHGSLDIVSSPFFNVFALLPLGLLTEDEARRLIREPMREAGQPSSPGLEDFLYDLAGGHPLALQTACYHALATGGDRDEIAGLTRQDMEAHFQNDWERLTKEERDIFAYLSDDWQEELRRATIHAALRNLSQKGLLVMERGSCRYPSRVWAEFVTGHLR